MTEALPPASAMPPVDSVLVEPPRTIEEEEPFPVLPPDVPAAQAADADDQAKRKGRPRLMRGISRMSSFPNLKARGRASSAPYDRSGAAMSCSNLASSSSAANGLAPSASPASRSGEPSSSPPMSAPLSSSWTRVATNVGGSNGAAAVVRPRRTFKALWDALPYELKLHVLRQLSFKELVAVSRVNREFHRLCFDGQLWMTLDASEIYKDIPNGELITILNIAGPFVKNLNLRGCMQMGSTLLTRKMAYTCRNLVKLYLEGVQIEDSSLGIMLSKNERLASLDLTGLDCVSTTVCKRISEHCPNLEMLNVTWCRNVLAADLAPVVLKCPKLRDLRLGDLRGNGTDMTLAKALFETNQLERLILTGSPMVTDKFVRTLMRGCDTYNLDMENHHHVPPRRLRHLDLGHCRKLTAKGIWPLAYSVPELEGLVVGGCTALNNESLIPVLATCGKLTHLNMEDLEELTDELLVDHLVKSPCVATLKHLSLSFCKKCSDVGVIPVLRQCKALRSLVLDNTDVSDQVLFEALAVVEARDHRTRSVGVKPRSGLSLIVYDCHRITWQAVRRVLSHNTDVLERFPRKQGPDGVEERDLLYPTQIVSLLCFFGWQMTVDEHTRRVLRGDFAAAQRLEAKWYDYMATSDRASAGEGGRRMRRRVRAAQNVHYMEASPVLARRHRARTASCAVM